MSAKETRADRAQDAGHVGGTDAAGDAKQAGEASQAGHAKQAGHAGDAKQAGHAGDADAAQPVSLIAIPPTTPGIPLLPTSGRAAPERADAARNRRKILDAAARLVAEVGPAAVTMNQVAHASGMGVGTVYRRFGDVSQLLWALLDDRERQFQEAYMGGPPPLGPGAPDDERLHAFLDALVDRVLEQRELLLAAQAAAPSATYTSGAYLAMHTHVTLLLSRLRPAGDSALLAHMLLAPFSPSLMHHLTVERDVTADELKAGVNALLHLGG
ncbi:TetR/AcrR family transcriptional regulator [Streptomyces sp. Je 1-79]|uniref:TetR/AcrR family transcriptional regulator n=1 Tax=Streptomyces sp. Je 1-79 TaxID=2943847 RepID=UPI0027E567B6|nr:TetR/AcrR family transcriptional regulator [Streptomyces sp. Je 1-79]